MIKVLPLLLLIIALTGCGKSKMETVTAGGETTSTSSDGSSLKCESNSKCKAACDGGSYSGDKAECDYEEYKRWPYKPHCDRLKACYAKPI